MASLSLYEASQRERAAVAYLSRLPRDLSAQIRDASRAQVVPMAVRAATARARTGVERTIAAGGRYSDYKGTPGVAFGGARKVTSTGVPGRTLVRPLEYGSDGRRWRDYLERRKGGTVSVLRRTTRQFTPATPDGSFIAPAMESIAEDVLALWVGIVEDAAVRALDGGR